MAEDLKNQPNYCCAAYKTMDRAWAIMRDTCASTLHLRDQGSRYLPMEPAEDTRDFEIRRSRAIFFNAVERTLHGLVGLVFRNEPTLGDDAPEAIRGIEATDTASALEGHWENIDLAGTHGSVFCKEVFTDTMHDGHAAILVDMSPPLPEGATLADERQAGRRPYWVSYKADQIINWRTTVVNGQTKLDLIVFKECSQEPDGEYGEKEVTRYRVLIAGHPVGARNAKEAKNEQDHIQSAYRFLLADLMPFGKNARICLEHGADNKSTEHYETVTYWYGAPSASLVKTDELKIGDAASEFAPLPQAPPIEFVC